MAANPSLHIGAPESTTCCCATFQKRDTCKPLPIALSAIVIIGSIIAAVLLFPQIGYSFFAIIGAGVALGTAALFTGIYEIRRAQSEPSYNVQPPHRYTYEERSEIYRETRNACNNGYSYGPDSRRVVIDHTQMLAGAETYENLPPLESGRGYQTVFSVVEDDTLNVLLALKASGIEHPVGINMANRYRAGGGVAQGCPAQEESIARRSDYMVGLESLRYPLPETGGNYCPHVKVFREDEAHNFAFMETPQEVALVAVAAYDLREGSRERNILERGDEYARNTREKIRNMLRIIATKDHTHIVLGALGCGAFRNNPSDMAQFFQEVFQEEEFRHCFQEVQFAILNISPNDQRNIDAFTAMCNNLRG